MINRIFKIVATIFIIAISISIDLYSKPAEDVTVVVGSQSGFWGSVTHKMVFKDTDGDGVYDTIENQYHVDISIPFVITVKDVFTNSVRIPGTSAKEIITNNNNEFYKVVLGLINNDLTINAIEYYGNDPYTEYPDLSCFTDDYFAEISDAFNGETIGYWYYDYSKSAIYFLKDGMALQNTLYSGTEQDKQDFAVSISPNPAKDFVNIKFGKIATKLVKSIEIYNNTGELVASESKISSDEQTIDCTDEPSGHYIVRLKGLYKDEDLSLIIVK